MRSPVIRPLIFLTLAVLLASCARYSTRQDLQKDNPASILANLDSVPPALLQDALDAILAAPNPKGETYALDAAGRRQFQDPVSQAKILARLMRGESAESRNFVLARLKAKPELITAESAEWLVKNDLPGTPDLLFAAVEKNSSILSPAVAQYFIDKRYAPFVPMIVANVEKGQNVEQNLKVLAGMNTPESNNALLDLAGKDTPARSSVLRVLPDIKEPEARQKAEGILEQTWQTNEPGPVRTTALEGYAAMRGMDAAELERDRAFPMADAQADLAVNTLPDKTQQTVQPSSRVTPQQRITQPVTPLKPAQREITQTPPDSGKKTDKAEKKSEDKKSDKAQDQKKPVEDKRIRPETSEPAPPLDDRASAAYWQRLERLFLDTFGESGGPAVLRRINDTLATYSESRSTSSDFMIRSYRRRYGGSDAVIRKLLARGLRQPDSLGVVVSNIKAEYAGKEMQVYALARMFALQRWQAQVILELSQEVQL
jgi:hypothetical protein